MGQVVGHPPNVGGWPHNEPWLDATRSTGRLNAALMFAGELAALDSEPLRVIRAAVDRGTADTVAAIFAAFGVTEWTAETESAVTTALTTRDADVGPLSTAIAQLLRRQHGLTSSCLPYAG